ncbi:class I SAM-dependent methyltransferase [Verticiella sediminum]|uniref:Class I SAM-dependent methyltransferase n=1 Tax=Verticiella sediminum TaxID=1247510 RepID=A0A556AWI7_9BURK|nr:methyltransferase domain-containing protein [Verticiella sediminum]TSH97294.1 class I SAM-dependent methyltransferase [Verticiella sediminum]
MKISHSDLAAVVPALLARGKKTLLHVGCGTAPRSRLPECFQSPEWTEIRLDIDASVNPDIVASLTDMRAVASATVDAIWSSHNIEHLEGFEVARSLDEFHRVLKPAGFTLLTLPDMKKVAALIAEDKSNEVVYTSPAGPITPLDMMFGHQASLAAGKRYMAHRTGFTATSIRNKLVEAGFSEVRVMQGSAYDLWAIAIK